MKHFLRIAALLALFLPSGVEAATKFAYCASSPCTWDSTNTPNIWFTATNGGGSATAAPTSIDVATFDGNSCAGNTIACTFNVGATINGTSNTLQQIILGACTGTTTGCTINFASGNPSIILTSQNGISVTGTGTRVVNLGTGTFTVTGVGGNLWDATTTTGMTLTAGSSTIVHAPSGVGNQSNFIGGGLTTYGTFTVSARTTGSETTITGANTFVNLNVSGAVKLNIPGALTTTVTGSIAITGTSSGLVYISPNATNPATLGTLALSGASGLSSTTWAAFKQVTVTGGTISGTAIFDLGANTSITPSAPAAGGSGGKIIGG